MPPNITGTAAFEDFLVRAAAVQIDGEQMAAVFRRPVIAEINHHPYVRVATAEGVRSFAAGFRPTLLRVEVPVVRVLVDERVGARVRIDRVRTDEVRAGEVVPEMAVDRVDEEQLAVLVPIVSPWVGGTAAQDLEDLSLRVITPHRAAHGNAFLGRRARNANLTRS